MKSFTKYLIILAVVSATTDAAEFWRTGSDGREYYFNSDQQSDWFEALKKCEQKDMQLLEIKSIQKNDVMLPMLRLLFTNPTNLWLGAHDDGNTAIDVNRPFYWESSGNRMAFSNWLQNQPDNSQGKEHCVHIFQATFTWNDARCTTKMGFICEHKPVKPVSYYGYY